MKVYCGRCNEARPAAEWQLVRQVGIVNDVEEQGYGDLLRHLCNWFGVRLRKPKQKRARITATIA